MSRICGELIRPSLKTIYDQYLNSGLYESFLVSLVARFEWFLADVLTDFLSHYPLRITEKFNGVPSAEKIEVRVLLESADKNDLVRRVISGHVSKEGLINSPQMRDTTVSCRGLIHAADV
ncbi:hypothetical protein, partial [Xanthomonas citri]|uniref:hypothetical protein n=1 Tax=Xanthomonas citri TaxID=346 RepID=UPI001F1BBDB0